VVVIAVSSQFERSQPRSNVRIGGRKNDDYYVPPEIRTIFSWKGGGTIEDRLPT